MVQRITTFFPKSPHPLLPEDAMQNQEDDQPLTPAGRLFVQPKLDQVVNVLVGLEHPINISSIKAELSTSLLVTHPRFSSLLVCDQHGVEHWRKTQVDLDRHLISIDSVLTSVNDYLAGLAVSCPLPLDKPLWEIHLLMAHNCLVFRIHHSLGDLISFMSFLSSRFGTVNDDDAPAPPAAASQSSRRNSENTKWWESVWNFLKMVWLTVVFSLRFAMRSTWVKDYKTVISGGNGVELWPRRVATASFLLEDMKLVKKVIPNATVNDVLFGVISSGLSKYLDIHSPEDLPDGLQVTGLSATNLRPHSGLVEISNLMKEDSRCRWGNVVGLALVPVYYNKSGRKHPLQYLYRCKAMLDQKKQSLEAPFVYGIVKMAMSLLGSKAVTKISYKVLCNTTFTISNVPGPQKKLWIGDNPVTHLSATVTAIPHAILMHFVSYDGRGDLQISVAKDIIPNVEDLAKYFEDALLDIKNAVINALEQQKRGS